MPRVGIEPTRCCHHQILSLARLPVSPPRHSHSQFAILTDINTNKQDMKQNKFKKKNLFNQKRHYDSQNGAASNDNPTQFYN